MRRRPWQQTRSQGLRFGWLLLGHREGELDDRLPALARANDNVVFARHQLLDAQLLTRLADNAHAVEESPAVVLLGGLHGADTRRSLALVLPVADDELPSDGFGHLLAVLLRGWHYFNTY